VPAVNVDHRDVDQDRADGDHLGADIDGMTTTSIGGETKDPTAVLLVRPRRARDASGLLQLVEEPGRVRLGHVE
jgi:hypothetical protein